MKGGEQREHNFIKGAVLLILPLIFFMAAICIGRYSIRVEDVFKSFWMAVTGMDTGVDPKTYAVVVGIRFQRAVQGLLVGEPLHLAEHAFKACFATPWFQAACWEFLMAQALGQPLRSCFFRIW